MGLHELRHSISAKDFENAGQEYCSEHWSYLVNGTLKGRYPDLQVVTQHFMIAMNGRRAFIQYLLFISNLKKIVRLFHGQVGTESKYCFSLAYIFTFLTSGLGIPSDLSFPVMGAVRACPQPHSSHARLAA